MAHAKSWFRFYNRMPDSPEILELDPAEIWMLIRLWCLASESGADGRIPHSKKAIEKRFSITGDIVATYWRHLSALDLIRDEDGVITVQRWNAHQYEFTSKTPTARADQKRKERKHDNAEHKTTSNVASNGEECRQNVASNGEECRHSVARESQSTDTDTEYVLPPTPYVNSRVHQTTTLAQTASPSGPAQAGASRKPKAPAPPAPGFQDFWKLYPRKNDKQLAIKAWNELAPDETLRDEIMTALQAQRESSGWTSNRYSVGDHRDTIVYAVRWIKNRRWEDEISEGEEAPTKSDLHPGFTTPMAGLPPDVRDLARRIEERRRKIAAGEPVQSGPPPEVLATLQRMQAEAAQRQASEEAHDREITESAP